MKNNWLHLSPRDVFPMAFLIKTHFLCVKIIAHIMKCCIFLICSLVIEIIATMSQSRKKNNMWNLMGHRTFF